MLPMVTEATYQNNSISHKNEEKEPVEPDQMNIFQVNPFLTNLRILYPPKTSGNQKWLTRNELILVKSTA